MAPSVFASAPNHTPVTPGPGIGPSGASSARFLKWKNEFRVISGVQRNQKKGTAATMYTAPASMKVLSIPKGATATDINYGISCPPGSTPPCADTLPTTYESWIYEPSDGTHSNFGSGTDVVDDQPHVYGPDSNFFGLCGPGAADVAMFYWPAPNNNMDVANVVDPLNQSVSTTWNDHDIDGNYRYRGYMAYLAWLMSVPGWTAPYTGLMDQYNPNPPNTGGVRLQELEQAMNWEETGHSSASGFYIVEWHYDANYNPSGGTLSTLVSDVSDDIYYSNVPVVAEVNAKLMPNWPNNGGQVLHFITIVGYDSTIQNSDGSFGQFYYTDTCGSTTACGSNNDGGINTVSYNQMWNAIMSAPYSPSTGDGGWIW
jgi:hypothetical protein